MSAPLTLFGAEEGKRDPLLPPAIGLEEAIAEYWRLKDDQSAVAELRNSTAEGSAKAVRGGGHFNPIIRLVVDVYLDAGFPVEAIRTDDAGTFMPGHYRPGRKWDLAVRDGEKVTAVFEMKALGGPSFGNNFNNRIEEAIGSATDLRAHYEARSEESPFMGYFFLMDNAPGSRRPTKGHEEWDGLSYQERFSIVGQRMIDSGLYDAVCYVCGTASQGHIEPSGQMGFSMFRASIMGAIVRP